LDSRGQPVGQAMMPGRKKKEEKKPKLIFDAEKVFSVKPAEDLGIDQDSSRYRAQKGEGGDRRA